MLLVGVLAVDLPSTEDPPSRRGFGPRLAFFLFDSVVLSAEVPHTDALPIDGTGT